MKAVQAKDLVIGAIYSDLEELNELATLLKFTGRGNGFNHFDYYGGADHYGHDDGGSYARFQINPIFYELSPSEIEQYLPSISTDPSPKRELNKR